MSTDYQLRPFTFDEYQKLGECGILKPDDRVELLDGEIVLMPPVGEEHNAATIRFNRLLTMRLGDAAMVLPTGSIKLSNDSAPQPDFAILKPRDDFYRGGHAGPPDVLALVELSLSTIAYDSKRKLSAYARGRIAEYWIADLCRHRILRMRDPNETGYGLTDTFGAGESLSLIAFPDIEFSVDELLGDVSFRDE